MKATYSEKLKDPRWQKKRLKVLERDGWTCQECDNKDDTLHVHHLKYHKSGNPWSTPLKDLQTLCEDCHQLIKEDKNKTKKLMVELEERINGFDDDQIKTLCMCATLLSIAPTQTAKTINAITALARKAFEDGIDYVE